ncbi:MAG: holo-[acyl-carrier protein] synthase [Planctomycetota bacterium]|jgi:holo-[acyl-carrier protein] synthase
MTIVGLGMDLARIDRLEEAFARRGGRLLTRLFTAGEQAYCDRRMRTRFTHYAGRFAVKESVMKVLGTGWARGVRWVDIEVTRAPGQAPQVLLHGECARIAAARGIEKIHVTITHDAGIAAAVAVAEGSPIGQDTNGA